MLIKAYDVGYDMGLENLNSETRAKKNEWKGKVVSHISWWRDLGDHMH